MVTQIFLFTMVIATFTSITQSEKMVAERGNVTEWSQKYLYFARVYVTRKSRKSPYYVNIEFHNKQTWTNNVTIHMVFYEYLTNKYRRTFVEVHTGVCDLLHKDPLIGLALKNIGCVCPLPPGANYFVNMTVPLRGFAIPFRKFMMNTTLYVTNTKDLIVAYYLNGHIE